jgi:hypothetical protein
MKTDEQERARQQLIDAVKEWREAACPYARGSVKSDEDGESCDGDNHLMECPVERARQDILAAHNKVEQLKAG